MQAETTAEFSMEDLMQEATKAIREAERELGQVNILIAGRTGVGKSTLINAVFQGNLAETGQGEPVTKDTRLITKPGFPLAIWDTRGLEMQEYEQTLQGLKDHVLDKSKETDPQHHIHIAWLCILEDNRRVEEAEIALCELLAECMPVVGVVTQSKSDQGFKAEVQRLLPQAKNVIGVRAKRIDLDDEDIVLPAKGLAELVELTGELIPESVQRAFAAAQKASIQEKKKRAELIIKVASTAAAGIGATPIPFSDAIALAPIQIGMLAKLSSVFGLRLSEDFFQSLVKIALGVGGATLIGRTVVTGLLKLIPGIGTVAGVAISATTAAALTGSLGKIYLSTLVKSFTANQGDPPSADDITATFQAEMKKKRGEE